MIHTALRAKFNKKRRVEQGERGVRAPARRAAGSQVSDGGDGGRLGLGGPVLGLGELPAKLLLLVQVLRLGRLTVKGGEMRDFGTA